ncbi:REF/SRPP-like protein At3g05500 [Cajanus cajan]|uniref:REF/SRPP-like protein At3g05500 n=1 Tax=Cajanus cajan TaxID=3821 RepID=UPI00098DB493|nr:REF/SRPP-like protein At3g05500 [Cajanus cajan]
MNIWWVWQTTSSTVQGNTTTTVTAMRFAAAVMTHCAKDRSGVRAVEEAVKIVVGPVYEKFHLLPDELLRIAQSNPDHSVAPAHPPPPPRAAAADIARAAYSKCEPAAKGLYGRLEVKAEQCAAAAAWRRVVPRTVNYNEKVVAAAEKGCRVSERIAKMYSERRKGFHFHVLCTT